MIIGFDLQALQTEQSRNRGIGRYSENTLKKILELNSNDALKLFLNGNYKDTINIKPNEKSEIVTITYKIPSHHSKNTENNLTQFLEYRNAKMDILQILSPFEGFPSNLPVINPYLDRLASLICTIIYDFIPLHYPDHYFANNNFKNAYFKNLKTVYDSDFLFSISESTRIDAINILGLNPKKVVNIEGASSQNFYKIENLSTKELDKLKKKYGIKNRFVLYTGGIEFRKNIEKSIIAFSKIEKPLLDSVSYVLVCEIHGPDKKRLMDLARSCSIESNIIFTGFIPDEDLNLLYNSCDAFIFPSLIEGFGLPVAEAMQCGAAVIGSNSSSIAELIEDADFMFDPTQEDDIARLISKILTNQEFRKKSITHSIQRSKNLSWDNVAKKILSTYQSLKEEAAIRKSQLRVSKPKIAYFSPLPPKKSGIANYSAKLLPFLSNYWDIDIFIDDYSCSDPYLTNNFNVFSYLEFERLHNVKPYDSIIYQIGNSENHVYMFDLVKKYPGVVILHDVYLSGVIYWITGKVGKLDEFIDEVIYSHGEKGRELVNKAQKNLVSWDSLIWNLQVNRRLLDNANQIIVHSEWDMKNVVELHPHFADKISLIHQFAPLLVSRDKPANKKALGFSRDDFLICSFGFVVSTKKIDSIIKNLKNFLLKNEKCKYVVVGDASDPYGQTVKRLVEDLKLSDRIFFTEFIDDFIYKKYLSACDVCISLRGNARAGTSASVNHALGAGIPTIISDEGPFSEFCDDVVIKLKPSEEKNLSAILDDLYHNDKKLNDLSEKAMKFAQDNLSIDLCVEKYVEAVRKSFKKEQDIS